MATTLKQVEKDLKELNKVMDSKAWESMDEKSKNAVRKAIIKVTSEKGRLENEKNANNRQEELKDPEVAYKDAVKMKSSWATAADSIARLTGTRPSAVYNWAKKHNFNIVINGNVLTDKNNIRAFVSDLTSDKTDQVNKLVDQKITFMEKILDEITTMEKISNSDAQGMVQAYEMKGGKINQGETPLEMAKIILGKKEVYKKPGKTKNTLIPLKSATITKSETDGKFDKKPFKTWKDLNNALESIFRNSDIKPEDKWYIKVYIDLFFKDGFSRELRIDLGYGKGSLNPITHTVGEYLMDGNEYFTATERGKYAFEDIDKKSSMLESAINKNTPPGEEDCEQIIKKLREQKAKRKRQADKPAPTVAKTIDKAVDVAVKKVDAKDGKIGKTQQRAIEASMTRLIKSIEGNKELVKSLIKKLEALL